MTDGYGVEIVPGDTLVSDATDKRVIVVGERTVRRNRDGQVVQGILLRADGWAPLDNLISQDPLVFSIPSTVMRRASVWRRKNG